MVVVVVAVVVWVAVVVGVAVRVWVAVRVVVWVAVRVAVRIAVVVWVAVAVAIRVVVVVNVMITRRMKPMKIEKTEKQIMPQQSATSSLPFQIGTAYFIRTVTYHLVGRVSAVNGKWLSLADAAWVADSGRFAQALKTGMLNEVEEVGGALVNSDSITDAFIWKHGLPLETK